ncbi:C1q-related factor-like [Littorina saxatilis]|uniref:C1q domain-containing protein n=1 Tax=Littorina saxatilis TaxID=31220 RepID=A0AAN9G5F4_9CAEN
MFSSRSKTFTFFILFAVPLSICTNSDADVNARAVDDVSLESLQVVVDQQAVLTQSLQAELQAEKNRAAAAEADLLSKVTAAQNNITALQTRVATLSTAVAFTVRFTFDDALNGIPLHSTSPMLFDDIVLNTGDGYDPQNGTFTAPVAGTYSFFLTQMGVNGHGGTILAIVQNGTTLDFVYCKDHEDQGSTQVTSHLVYGEQVWVRQQGGNAVRGSYYTVFTGYLLLAD